MDPDLSSPPCTHNFAVQYESTKTESCNTYASTFLLVGPPLCSAISIVLTPRELHRGVSLCSLRPVLARIVLDQISPTAKIKEEFINIHMTSIAYQ